MADISTFLQAWNKPDQEAALKEAFAAALEGKDVANKALLSEAFESAAIIIKSLTQEPSQSEMLELYAFFKQAKGEKPKAAGLFDFVGKEKYKAWEKVQDLPQEKAQAEYIKLVDSLIEKYGTR